MRIEITKLFWTLKYVWNSIWEMWISQIKNWLLVFRTSLDSCFAGPVLFLLVLGTGPAGYFEDWIHRNECIILFLTRYFMSWTHKSAKNYHWALISPLLPRAAFSDRALWRHHNWSVTSCEREILALWRHNCLLSLHAQIGATAIFTSE